jgi:NitT/TauT family transport system permease protein
MAGWVRQSSWWLLSVGLFLGFWELCFLLGWIDANFLPPPHVFIPQFPEQARHFDFGHIIPSVEAAPSGWHAVLMTSLATILRVVEGLALGFVLGTLTGIAIRYFELFGRLTLPTLKILAPISPVAWLPVAVNLFGIGEAPAIFLVFVAVYFIIVVATIAEIDGVPETYLNVARIMGARRRQLYLQVVLPAILPGLFVILRLNMFAAWMVVLIAESAGAESGLGAVVMLARNTNNVNLVFLGILVIGIIGFLFDAALRLLQRHMLYWVPEVQASLQR